MDFPNISFVIATKNRANLIGETLQSLLDQTVPEWEALIIDDQGDDKTKEVVESFADSRLKYYKPNPAHGVGQSCARNFGALYASAPIIAILDSDDICYPNRIEVTLRAFEENPDTEVFYGNIDIWEEETGIIRDRKTPIVPFSVERLLESSFIPHPTVAFRRETLINNPYNQFFRMAEDYELLTRLAVAGKKFVYTEEKILKYRLGSQNISSGGQSELVKSYDSLVKMLRSQIDFEPEILNTIEKLQNDQQ